MTRFLRLSLQVKKNVSFMTMFNVKGSELTRMNIHNLPQMWSFMDEKFGCMNGGIKGYAVGIVGFYGISTFVVYLMPNPF